MQPNSFLLLAEPLTLIHQPGSLLLSVIPAGAAPCHQEMLTANRRLSISSSLIVNGTFRFHHSDLAKASQFYNVLLL